MKKILLFIVGLFGIFGCCFGETFTISASSLSPIYYDGGSSVFGGNSRNNYPVTTFTNFEFSGYTSDLFLKEICFQTSYDRDPSYFSLYGRTYSNYFQSGVYYCWSGLDINLKDYNYSISGYSFGRSLNSNLYNSNSSFGGHTNYYFLYDGKKILLHDLSAYSNQYFQTFVYVTLSVPSNPKLIVNYGNTSYEYEIDGSNDVEIHLKSPVVMSGSYNYVYDGPIGINLFYNNTSQFYDKDKLYLKSMYWYNNNIFTPICL